jgi:hypothetical protein
LNELSDLGIDRVIIKLANCSRLSLFERAKGQKVQCLISIRGVSGKSDRDDVLFVQLLQNAEEDARKSRTHQQNRCFSVQSLPTSHCVHIENEDIRDVLEKQFLVDISWTLLADCDIMRPHGER